MRICYFILAWTKLKKCIFFLFTSTNLPSKTFQSHKISRPSAIKKTNCSGRLGTFFLFLALFSFVHINFQYQLNSHKKLFIMTVNLFSFIALLVTSHLQVHFFYFSVSLCHFKKKQTSINYLGSLNQNKLQK